MSDTLILASSALRQDGHLPRRRKPSHPVAQDIGRAAQRQINSNLWSKSS
jgi:hypothetical protein